MTFTRSFAPALALVLAACGGGGGQPPAARDWRAALRAGDGAGAEIALKRELEGGAPVAALAPFLGEAELVQGDLREARRWLGDGAFAPEVAARGFHMQGRLRLREGDLAGAGQSFDRALSTAPDDSEVWVDVARLRYRGGEQAQAVDASRKALALGPDNPAALLLRAQMVRDAGGNAAALPLLERGLQAAPDNPDLLADYAATLGELGRAKDMLGAARRLATAAPGDRRPLYLQAVLAARAGNAELARGLLQRSGDLDREMPAAILLLALVDLDNGNPASAAQGLDRLMRRQPDNQRVEALLAHSLAAAGNERELIARFADRAHGRYLALLVGRAYEALGERARAARYLDRSFAAPSGARVVALAADRPLDVASLRGTVDGANTIALVRGQIAAGRKSEARATAAQWLRRFPGSADALGLAGDAALAAGDEGGALRYYRAAAAIRRPWPLTKRIAAALETAGDPAAAEALVAAHLAGEPNNAEAAALLSRSLAARGERTRSKLLADHARVRGG